MGQTRPTCVDEHGEDEMPFQTWQDAEHRLLEQTPLTPQEVRDLLPWNQKIDEKGKRRLDIELSLQNLEAIQKFEKSSSRLTGWLIAFTVVLVLLTVALVVLTIVLVLAGRSSQPRFVHHSGDPEMMFDDKTVQECWAGPVVTDDGTAELKRAIDFYNDTNPNTPHIDYSAVISSTAIPWDSAIAKAKARVLYLREHPAEQKVHVHGLPYCSELK